jgi:uncharacterized protein
MNRRTLIVATVLTATLCVISCVNLENILLFASGNSSGHVVEYHLDDSLSGIPQSEWSLYETVGTLKTDAVWIKGDTLIAPLSKRSLILFFNARDVCLLSGVTIGKLFRSLGFDFFSLDFRGYGRSYPDFKPSETTLYEDGEAALRFLTDSLKYDVSSIILSGFSLGTGVATEIAKRHHCRALVLFAAYTNMDNSVETLAGGYNIPGDWVLESEFDNLSKISSVTMPLCLFSGSDDTFVTPEHTKQLFQKANEPKEMHMLPGQDHNRFVIESFVQWSGLFTAFAANIN